MINFFIFVVCRSNFLRKIVRACGFEVLPTYQNMLHFFFFFLRLHDWQSSDALDSYQFWFKLHITLEFAFALANMKKKPQTCSIRSLSSLCTGLTLW